MGDCISCSGPSTSWLSFPASIVSKAQVERSFRHSSGSSLSQPYSVQYICISTCHFCLDDPANQTSLQFACARLAAHASSSQSSLPLGLCSSTITGVRPAHKPAIDGIDCQSCPVSASEAVDPRLRRCGPRHASKAGVRRTAILLALSHPTCRLPLTATREACRPHEIFRIHDENLVLELLGLHPSLTSHRSNTCIKLSFVSCFMAAGPFRRQRHDH